MKSLNWKEGILLILILLIFLGVIYGFFHLHFSTIYNQWELDAIEKNGISTQALVKDKYHSSDGLKSIEYYTLDYQYEVEGRLFNKSKYVDVIIHDYNHVGDSIEIKYLVNNPKVSDIEGNWGLEVQWMQLIIIDFILILCIIVFLWKYFKNKKNPNRYIPNKKQDYLI